MTLQIPCMLLYLVQPPITNEIEMVRFTYCLSPLLTQCHCHFHSLSQQLGAIDTCFDFDRWFDLSALCAFFWIKGFSFESMQDKRPAIGHKKQSHVTKSDNVRDNAWKFEESIIKTWLWAASKTVTSFLVRPVHPLTSTVKPFTSYYIHLHPLYIILHPSTSPYALVHPSTSRYILLHQSTPSESW